MPYCHLERIEPNHLHRPVYNPCCRCIYCNFYPESITSLGKGRIFFYSTEYNSMQALRGLVKPTLDQHSMGIGTEHYRKNPKFL